MLTRWIVKTFVPGRENPNDPKVRTRLRQYGQSRGHLVQCAFVPRQDHRRHAGAVGLWITADVVNNLSDFSSSIVTFLGFKLASRPADDDHPYGHGRYEYLAGYLSRSSSR